MLNGFTKVKKDPKDRPSRVRVPYTQHHVLAIYPAAEYNVHEFVPYRLGKTMPYSERVTLEGKAFSYASDRSHLPVGALALTVQEREFHKVDGVYDSEDEDLVTYSDLSREELKAKGIEISGGLLPFGS